MGTIQFILISISLLNSFAKAGAEGWVSPKPELCKVGSFYRNPEFFGDAAKEFVTSNEGIFAAGIIQCVVGFLSPLFGGTGAASEMDYCGCDCRNSHLASGSRICDLDMQSGQPPVGCRCEYSKEDLQNIPCTFGGKSEDHHDTVMKTQEEEEEQSPSNIKDGGSPIAKKCENSERFATAEERSACWRDTCSAAAEPILHVARLIICNPDFLNQLTGNISVDGIDTCALDCYYTHGARKEPFGGCVAKNGQNFCVCRY